MDWPWLVEKKVGWITLIHALELHVFMEKSKSKNIASILCYALPLHSQKQSAHWAVDVTAQVVPC